MNETPSELTTDPFTNRRAQALGVTARQLMGTRYVQVHPRVWRVVGLEMTHAHSISAAQLAMPDDAHLTGISRIQRAGLDYGPMSPIRFVVARDHHIALDGIFLHRTKALPPIDDDGVAPSAAFIAYCALARVIDAIKVGEWLLAAGLMSKEQVRALALAQLWRAGAPEAIWVFDHLGDRSRSLKESETRALLRFAGLPEPEVNVPVRLEEGVTVIPDLLYRDARVAVEYEGLQHQEDRGQYERDIDRFADFRHHDLRYVQVTQAKLRNPRRLAGDVFRELLARGYDGAPPVFGDRWSQLFGSVTLAVGPRRDHLRQAS